MATKIHQKRDDRAATRNLIIGLAFCCVAALSAGVLRGGGGGHATTPDGKLLSAARHGNVTLLEEALREGADVNVTGGYSGQTALMIAAEHDHVEVARSLILAGADVAKTSKRALRNGTAGGKAAVDYAEARVMTNGYSIVYDSWNDMLMEKGCVEAMQLWDATLARFFVEGDKAGLVDASGNFDISLLTGDYRVDFMPEGARSPTQAFRGLR